MVAVLNRLLVFILLFTSLHSAYAQEFGLDDENRTWLLVQALGGVNSESSDYYSGGAYLYGELETSWVGIYGRVGLMSIHQDSATDEHEYFGVDGGGGIMAGDEFTLFAGVGLMGGRTNSCTREQLTLQNCDDSTILGAYPEAGVRFKVTQNFMASLFARRYSLNKELENFTAHGISLGFRF